jgi:alpha,alpha-trehalase
MTQRAFYLLLAVLLFWSCEQPVTETQEKIQYYKPWESMPAVFEAVQLSGVFEDSKTFVDCLPLNDPAAIESRYLEVKDTQDFDLKAFVEENFASPADPSNDNFNSEKPFEQHLNDHWDYLTRSAAQPEDFTTLISLPNKYVVPGGRFREIYYWDSYFTMIGLGASGRTDLVKAMLDNFQYLIDTVGYIPNGNRTYFLGRSQPPFYGAMVNLYAQLTDMESALPYLPSLQAEYDFWMRGAANVNEQNPASERVVLYGDYFLNRYFDNTGGPRQESYREDLELAEDVEDSDQLFLDLRAACESGWDFSARWFEDTDDFASIRTTKMLPVDLNSLLYNTEVVLSQLYAANGDDETSRKYRKKAENRYEAMNEVFWNPEVRAFQDVLWEKEDFSGRITAASFFPMYFRLSNQQNADQQRQTLLDMLLMDGGVATTPYQSGQQWDKPNGWAPLQWVAIKGLEHYGFSDEATDIRDRWLAINRKVYENTGKMMEKYNVADTTLLAGGGEYPNQDGFGWTNGVVLGLMADEVAY